MAERLTMQEVIEHCDETTELMERVFTCIHDGGEFGQIESKRYLEHKQTAEWLRELQKYKDLEEQGRLITLPCAVGDTVYGIVWENCHDGKCPWLDTTGKCTKGGISSEYCPQEVISWEFALEDLYNPRRFYLTREEAEAALKGENE